MAISSEKFVELPEPAKLAMLKNAVRKGTDIPGINMVEDNPAIKTGEVLTGQDGVPDFFIFQGATGTNQTTINNFDAEDSLVLLDTRGAPVIALAMRSVDPVTGEEFNQHVVQYSTEEANVSIQLPGVGSLSNDQILAA